MIRIIRCVILFAFVAGTVQAGVVWRRDWEQLASNTTITDANLDGTGSGVNIGTQDVTVLGGPVKIFNAADVGGFDLIPTVNSGVFDMVIEITSVQYGSDTNLTLDFVIGTGSSNSRNGHWFIEYGTMSGGVFTALPTVDSGSATWGYDSSVSGALTTSENFNDNTNPSALFGYNVGGRLQQLTVDPADALNGQNVAIRMGITSSALFAGFTDMALTASSGTPVPPVTITSFTTSDDFVVSNGTATLSWTTENPDGLILSPGIGDVTGLSSSNIVVSSDITYTLTATNAGGSVTDTVDITMAVPPPQTDRPNILFIVSEDNGPELGCYGDAYVSTPTLDQMAADGVRFESAYVPYSVCSPSRASFYTGLHITQNGHLGLQTHNFSMYEAYPTFYKLLQEAGYRTGLMGKLHINPANAVSPYIDYRAIPNANFALGDRNMSNYAEKARAFIYGAYSGADTSKPFVLTLNYPDAHYTMWDLAPTTDVNDPDTLPKDPLSWEEVDTFPWIGTTSQRLREHTAAYYNCLRRLDDGIAMVLQDLDDAGLTDNTLVVYIGDHGAQFSRGKTSVYEAGIRIPLIVRWPGEAVPGLVREELASTLDIMPTFLKAAGVAAPPGLTGRALQPLLEGKNVPWRKYIYSITTGSSANITCLQYSIRDERYKLISNPLEDPSVPEHLRNLENRSAAKYLSGGWYAGTSSNELATAPAHVQDAYARYLHPPRWELYDLQADPHEWINLADESSLSDVKQRLIDALHAWQGHEIIQDPMAVTTNQVFLIQSMQDASNIGPLRPTRWSYLDAFPPWREAAFPELYEEETPAPEGDLYETGFEADDGFTGFPSGDFTVFTSSITDAFGAVWTGDGGNSGIWNRSDIAPEGVQVLRVGADPGISTATVTLPPAITNIAAIQFSYANYSGSTDADASVQIRQVGSGIWTNLWTRHFMGLEVDWASKPWPFETLPVSLDGPYEIRFITEGERGIKFDQFSVFSTAPPTPPELVDFATWQGNHFTPSELADPLISGFDANPDGDGLPNGLEYKMGFLPKVWNAWPLENPAVDENGIISITYQEDSYTAGSVALQDTPDLLSPEWQDWQTRIVYPADSNGMSRVKAIRLPQTSDDQMFIRATTPAL